MPRELFQAELAMMMFFCELSRYIPASLFSEALFFSIRLWLLDSVRDMPYQSFELTLFARMVLLAD